MKLTFILIFCVGVAAAVVSCSRADTFAEINTDAEGTALKGFDAVAYFTVSNAVRGNQSYEFVWNGARWRFANAENLGRFKADPAAFAPQFGGYCSYAVSRGYTADGDPRAWKVVDGKLYLNYDLNVKEKWEQDQKENIDKASENWAKFKTKQPEHKG